MTASSRAAVGGLGTDNYRADEVAHAISVQFGLAGFEARITRMLEREFAQVREEERKAERARCLAVAEFWNVKHTAMRRDIKNGFDP